MKPGQVVATLHVGKAGVTDALAAELHDQVKRRKMVKVRLLKSSAANQPSKAMAEALALKSGTRLVELRGRTAVYASSSS